jgi:hypothetical protein
MRRPCDVPPFRSPLGAFGFGFRCDPVWFAVATLQCAVDFVFRARSFRHVCGKWAARHSRPLPLRLIRVVATSMVLLVAAPLLVPHALSVRAQTQAAAKLSSQQLDSLAAPVALYPDALLAQVLMAATYPADVTAAEAWSRANAGMKGDDAVKAVASMSWDPSVQSLVAFPQVLATMASKPDWTTQLGNAFIAQPNDVMDSVQRLRRAAQAAGNLKSSGQQTVVVEQSTIQIQPARPQVVYVPTYNPTVVYGAWPYPAYPPVYVPPPPGYAFASGLAAGVGFGVGIAITNSLWGGFNWNTHDVNINVNHYNNINVNHHLDVNNNTTSWTRNDARLNRSNAGPDNFNGAGANLGQAQRDAYRGRDDPRAQARQTLQTRTGQNLGGSASERVQGIRQGGTRNDALAGRNAAAGNDLHQRAQGLNRDNALRGAGDGNAARSDTQRGAASRQAIGKHAVGSGSAFDAGGSGRGGGSGPANAGRRGGGFAPGDGGRAGGGFGPGEGGHPGGGTKPNGGDRAGGGFGSGGGGVQHGLGGAQPHLQRHR